ncbi:MAG: HD domain-containing protein [Bacteroidales bacterium]|nr:HD domain-containing protein [Bacteroidales bacterium]
MNPQHAKLIAAMVTYDAGDARRIQHFMKVHDFAATIGVLEGLDEETLFILETAAIVHDIGIHVSEHKYGSSGGKYQELEGPAEAEKLLKAVGGYSDQQIERVCWLVGHHHTYTHIDGADYQILVEADFLVNIHEDGLSREAAERVEKNIFKTAAGRKLLKDMYLAPEYKF